MNRSWWFGQKTQMFQWRHTEALTASVQQMSPEEQPPLSFSLYLTVICRTGPQWSNLLLQSPEAGDPNTVWSRAACLVRSEMFTYFTGLKMWRMVHCRKICRKLLKYYVTYMYSLKFSGCLGKIVFMCRNLDNLKRTRCFTVMILHLRFVYLFFHIIFSTLCCMKCHKNKNYELYCTCVFKANCGFKCAVPVNYDICVRQI